MSQPSDESKEAREAMLSAVLERLSVNMGHMSDGTPMFLREAAKVVRDAASEREKREQVERERDDARENLKVLDKGTLGWRCFHCGEYFTPAQMDEARKHFGSNEAWVSFQQAEAANAKLREGLREALPYVENWSQANEEGWIQKKHQLVTRLAALLADSERKVSR